MRKGTIHVVQNMAPGGIELLVRDLTEQIPGPNLVFSLEGNPKKVLENWPSLWLLNSDVRAFEKKPGIQFDLIRTLADKFRDLKPKSVVTHHIGPLLYAGLAARLAGVRSIVHVEHDTWHFDLPRQKVLTRLACMLVRPKLVGVSEPTAKTVSAVVGRRDVNVIVNGVDLDRFRPKDKLSARIGWKLPRDAVIIGVVGRLEEVKGHDVLLQAMLRLPDKVIAVFAGDGSKAEALKEKAAALGIAERVRFLGPQNSVSTLYPAFDVFCMPSRAEGLPLALLEAQACGVAVVATNVGAMAEGSCPKTSRLVPPDNPRALADALADALCSDATMGPREFVENRFNWQKTLAAYQALTEA